ncbi:hypothetical protein CDA63_09000 [Hymenobacter amundsenii]|uniref:Helix-turn-helix domain-containing protein n=1 Tax=Hymenobacter amundsenii TaxID=2006685 RepID=A0A246FLB3_9BACT|nr:helix-turn-helix domain-containing protein [Hymenobacter amundsenii]OWP63503.1 hypothetical protein CDA63_09000 [Hymenobacter amundsenii]
MCVPTTVQPSLVSPDFLTWLQNISEEAGAAAARAEFARLSSASKPDPDRLTPRAELCAELGICAQTIINWEKTGIVTAHRIGRRVFYRRPEVMAALTTNGLAQPDGTRRNARRGKQQKTR